MKINLRPRLVVAQGKMQFIKNTDKSPSPEENRETSQSPPLGFENQDIGIFPLSLNNTLNNRIKVAQAKKESLANQHRAQMIKGKDRWHVFKKEK